MESRLRAGEWPRKLLFAVFFALAWAVTAPAHAEENAQPAQQTQAVTPSSHATPQASAHPRVIAHPGFYPSERQVYAWLDAGYRAFTSGEAHDDVFSIWGVNRWYWEPKEAIPVGADAALVGVSCETPQLLATHAAWRGVRSALPEARVVEAVYAQLAEQAGYCRLVVVGLTRSPARTLGLEYVLNVNGRRYGELRVSSSYGEVLTRPSDSIDTRDYAYVSVEFVERLDMDYAAADVDGRTYERTEIRTSIRYERRAPTSVAQRPRPSPYRYLVTENVDFPLVRNDGAPAIPADAKTMTLEVLAPSASYEVSVGLGEDDSYLKDDPPMTNPMAAVTVTAGQTPRITTARFPHTPVVIRLEEVLRETDLKDQQITVCQRDAKIPVVLVSFPSAPNPYQLRTTIRRLVEEGQKVLGAGELTITADVRGRKVLEGKYSAVARKAVLTNLP